MTAMTPNTRPTIGLLTCSGEPLSQLLWAGVADVAAKRDVNLICFPGNPIHSPRGFEAQANILYDLAGPENVDGLIIWSGGLAHYIDREDLERFCERFRPLPLVNIGQPLTGIPSVTLDNYQGVRYALLHLLEIHQHRRIAFIRGPENHPEEQERFRAYVDVLSEHGIPLDPALIAPGDFKSTSGAAAIGLLLDRRQLRPGRDLQAIVAENDLMALGALEALQARGIHIAGDIAVVGLDDIEEARYVTPPLTTVPSLPYEQGMRGAEILLALLAGEQVSGQEFLRTRVIVRQSCGCSDPIVVHAAVKPGKTEARGFQEAFTAQRTLVRYRIEQEVEPAATSNRAQVEQLLDAFVAELTGGTEGVFLSALNDVLQQVSRAGGPVAGWEGAISAFRRYTLPVLDPAQTVQAENLWQQARVIIEEQSQRAQAYQTLRARQLAQTLGEISSSLSMAVQVDELATSLAAALPQLGIYSGYISLYENPTRPTESARLVFALDNGTRRMREAEAPPFPTRQLAAREWRAQRRRASWIVEPLYLRGEQLGLLLLEAAPHQEAVCDILRVQLSGALKSTLLVARNADLYDQAVQAWRAAEEANRLKSRFLAAVSHELRTPLSLIVGASELMLESETEHKTKLPKSFGHDLRSIHDSAQYLSHLLSDVLDLASNQVGRLRLVCEPLTLDQVLVRVLPLGQEMAREKGLTWRSEIPTQLPFVWGDRTRLQQVILNLVNNAIKFTEQGEVTLTAEAEDGTVRIEVSDTGLGIPPEDQQSIFDEFSQSERTTARGYGGMGLGLAISRRLIELHGGAIGVRSSGQEGAGSTFYFTLPVLRDHTAATERIAGVTRKVLLLAEHAGRTHPLYEHLTQRGFDVEVLSTIENPDWFTQVLASPPGALVLDFEPAADRGWALMRALKANPATQDLPVIFYSLLDGQERGSILDLDYMVKPLGSAELAEALERQGLRESQGKTVLVVEDEPALLDLHARAVQSNVPGSRVLKAKSGREALQLLKQEQPDLVLLDLMMPEVNGFQVLEEMRANDSTRQTPVIVLTAQLLTEADMERLQQGVAVILGKGVFGMQEVLAQIEATLARSRRLGGDTQRVVRHAMAYIHEHYAEPLSRAELANHVGLNERYLTRCFRQELGITPLDYLNRYRVEQAKRLLEQGNLTITQVATAVGFEDSSYFGRVFRQEAGLSPRAYQQGDRPTT